MENFKFILIGFLYLLYIQNCYSLQCYVCNNQDSNLGKCLSTVDQCNPEYDMCLTEIKWGTMPYWQAGAEKQFYISKKCATKKDCEKTMKKFMPFCTHVWYEDWKCSECCAGDKCNYFVISNAEKSVPSILIILSFSISLLYQLRL